MLRKIGHFGNSSGSSKCDREHSLADLSANEPLSEPRSFLHRDDGGFARNAEFREMRANRVSDVGRR